MTTVIVNSSDKLLLGSIELKHEVPGLLVVVQTSAARVLLVLGVALAAERRTAVVRY